MSDPVVYDKAKYHYEGRHYPEELPAEQAFVHMGMFLGWLIENGLYSDEFEEDSADLIEAFKGKEQTGPQVFAKCDGVLADDMLNEEGNRFAADYLDFQHGDFLGDYDEVLGADLPSLYHVEDTWENYEKLKERLDLRYQEWKQQNSRVT